MKHPPFISYDFHPGSVVEFAGVKTRRKPTIRALAKNGTIWETFEGNDAKWRPWALVGEASE